MALDPSLGSVDLTRQLCNIFSVSGEERAIADAVEAVLAERAPHLTVTRDGDTVIARTELGRERRVAIAGHLDTVPVNGNLPVRDEVDAETGEPVIWGRGTVDMKAGVAVQLVLAVELDDPAVDLTWIWYDHEEVSSELNGLGRALRNRPELFAADFAILGEPSNGTIEGGCNGTMRALVTYTGKRAHSARSWMGVNAIHRAGAALERLGAFEAERVLVDGLEYREGLNAVRISGGVAGNVIPDRCEIEVNYRFAPSRDLAEAEGVIREFFADADAVEIVDRAPGARPGLDAPLAQQFVEAVGAPPVAKLGWTDVSRFSGLGIPAVNFGPGNPLLAHADDERVPIAQIEATERALRNWLNR
ncbi:succinyl-diaminopimelate desuccinylase [Leucobacter sp. OLJS4]|uniref:succinyl-diaminopimelate desuccinylase n=1 Tax=unclassified Leucobacter TaxID=2621730 RepID=UPI000C187007|nr:MULTISPECIES: succinyl-diaminopimelate desuccinylase [unclassified Leucobacter]PIJ43577.1 succinyl-diaminopimelate desuccinylase [Leucobacter sp. OLES1]PII81892.1 succinyl-diaminopimelate desuccinylase [Leucobacter sp. OLCALW19]PII86562.1 succinyl-diaminopimelate desuccinylase [Leucobacter sp. OLTLW20]PII90499.1 succinyl-diaminopimelate desuccinylase [Leucobacter sp. OLAS13]PII97530.1 succinyl-diaminopimelate desuccinylase [Leucobacter sp. OLDS2]